MAPKLFPLHTDFGNGQADQRVFQVDREYPAAWFNRRAVLSRAREEHQLSRLAEPEASVIYRRLAEQFAEDSGGLFTFEGHTASNAYTGETSAAETAIEALQWLTEQFAEDVAIVRREDSGTDEVALLTATATSGWHPHTVIGRSFFQIHDPIPDAERMNAGASGLVRAMTERGPMVRFVWGLETDAELNHRPGTGPIPRRQFGEAPLFVRTERQVLLPLGTIREGVSAAAFLIRVQAYPAVELTATELTELKSATESMTLPVRRYKGLESRWDRLLEEIEALQAVAYAREELAREHSID